MDEGEVVLQQVYDMYRWTGPKARLWLIGTHLGALLLTNRRLLFLSSGGSGLTERLLLGSLGSMILGSTRTKDLDLSALSNEGSVSAPLDDVTLCERKRRWDFAHYLSVGCRIGGEEHAYAFMSKYGFAPAKLDRFATQLHEAKQLMPG